MNKKINTYQQVSNQGKASNQNFLVELLNKIKNLINLGISPEFKDIERIKSLSTCSTLINYTVLHLNYKDNEELAKLFRDFLIALEDDVMKEVTQLGSQDFYNHIKNINHFIEISKG